MLQNSLRTGLIRPRAFGCPYHGVVRNGEYLIPGGEIYNEQGEKIDHKRVITSGMDGALYVLNPGLGTIHDLTAKEIQAEAREQRVWRSYSLWNPSTRYIDGVSMGTSNFHSLYHDGKHVWGITVDMYGDRIEVFVTDLLSLIDLREQKIYPSFRRKIGTVKLKVPPSWAIGSPLHRCVVIPHPNGKKFLVNVYDGYYASGGYCEFLKFGRSSCVITAKDVGEPFPYGELVNVIEVSLSGRGSTVKENLGAGISMGSNLTLYDYGDIYQCLYWHVVYVSRPGFQGYYNFCFGGTAILMQVYTVSGAKQFILNHTHDVFGTEIHQCYMHAPPYQQDLCGGSIGNVLLSHYSFSSEEDLLLWSCSCAYGVWAFGMDGAYFTYAQSTFGKAHPYGSAPPNKANYVSYQPMTDTWAVSDTESVGWI